MKRLQIQHLRQAGLPIERVATSAGVSPRTVDRVTTQDPIDDPGAHDAGASTRSGRPSKVAPYSDKIAGWLEAEPDLTSVAVFQRLRLEGFQGGKSSVYEFVRKHRPAKKPDGIVRFEAVAGEFCQHDFGQHVIRYEDGTKERIRFFVSQLKFSRMVRVRVVVDERTETVCHSVADAYQYFGGMPLIGVFDNPRTIVTDRKGTNIRWQDTFSWFTVECGFSPHATWPRRPQEKGGVENQVKFVKTSFFMVHTFRDRTDMLAKLDEWHVWANDERTSRATGEVARVRLMLEEPRLRQLGIDPSGFTLRYSRIVRTDGFIELHGLRYFAGFEFIGKSLTVRLGETQVFIHAGEGQPLEHPRNPANGKYSVLPEQRGQLLVKDGARPLVKRQLLMDLCPAAEWFMTEVRHRRADRWEQEVDVVFELLEVHGESSVRKALIEAGRRGVVGAEYVEAILEGHASDEVKQ